MNKPTTTLLVVAMNEIEGMRIIMPHVQPDWCAQILVLDGNSTDGTAEYAREMGYDVYVQKVKGLHQGYKEVWPLIRGDWVITFSPDGNSPPEYIPRLIEKMAEGYDMVIGSRYYAGAVADDDTFLTKLGNRFFIELVNRLFHWNYTDAMTVYRIYKKDLFYTLGLDQDSLYNPFDKLFFTRLGVEPILSARFAKEKLRFAEIACPEPPRVGGQSKLQIVRWGLGYATQIICDRFIPPRGIAAPKH
jgi:glycosyltransferase involved in cell wall biosynthesis